MAPSPRFRWRQQPRSTVPTTASATCGRPTSVGATCWWSPVRVGAGRFRRRAPPCAPGRRPPSRSSPSAASNFRHSWSKRPRSWCRWASAWANTAKDTCASRWWRPSSASVRPRAISAAFLKRVRKSCTTSSPWPNGARYPFRRTQTMPAPLKLGIAGLGTVGACVARLIERQHDALTARCGRPIETVAVTARSRSQKRDIGHRKLRWVADPVRLATDGEIDVFVELIGGDGDPARAAVSAALAAKKSVVTANKALLARHGIALAVIAEKNPVALNFEAAVGGAIPIVKTLREGLAGNSLARIYGILNGTCNYILTRMEEEKLAFADCLKEAQRLGYAEADPTFDIEGHDTAQKLAILASLAFGIKVDQSAGYVEGISSIAPENLAAAAELGYRVKLLRVAGEASQALAAPLPSAVLP